MAEHNLDKYAAHAVRDHSGLLNPARNPHAITDTASTAKAPASGTHSGDSVGGGNGYAGADTKGL
jgi:hypothetical protein